MRRSNSVLFLAFPAVALATVVMACDRTSTAPIEADAGDAAHMQHASTNSAVPTSPAEMKAPAAEAPPPSADGDPKRADFDRRWRASIGPMVVYERGGAIADESATDQEVRSQANQDVRSIYGLLLKHIDLSREQKEAMLALLVEDRIAATETLYRQAVTIVEKEQSARIASVIGDRKLKAFRDLEGNLAAYRRIRQIGELLQEQGAPLTERQRDGLLGILTVTADEFMATRLPADAPIEQHIAHLAEHERHVMELAPSVLSPHQVVYLDRQYQSLQYSRTESIARYRKEQANGTWPEDHSPSYPSW